MMRERTHKHNHRLPSALTVCVCVVAGKRRRAQPTKQKFTSKDLVLCQSDAAEEQKSSLERIGLFDLLAMKL